MDTQTIQIQDYQKALPINNDEAVNTANFNLVKEALVYIQKFSIKKQKETYFYNQRNSTSFITYFF